MCWQSWIDIAGGKAVRLRCWILKRANTLILRDMKHCQWWCWRSKSSGMWYCVIWQVAVTFWRIIVPLKIRNYSHNYTVPHLWRLESPAVIFMCVFTNTPCRRTPHPTGTCHVWYPCFLIWHMNKSRYVKHDGTSQYSWAVIWYWPGCLVWLIVIVSVNEKLV